MGLGVNASIVDPFLTGLGTYTVNLIRELIKIHQDLLVYTSHPQAFSIDHTQIRIISKQLGPAYGKRAHFRRLLWSQFILPRNLQKDKATALFSPVPEGIFNGTIPQYLVIHDVTPLKFPRDYALQWFYFQFYVRPLLRKAKRVITVSEQTKTDVLECFGISPRHICVIAGGCNHQIFHANIDTDYVKKKYGLQSYCLYVGNFHPHKNLVRLIGAFHRLPKNVKSQLVIAGKKDSRYFPVLKQIVEKLGLEKTVVFLGYVPLEDLPALYAGAAVFVLPSLHEGFGLPVVEAMACGVPVVAAKTGAMDELLKQSGILVDPTQPQELADAIHKVLTNKDCRERLSYFGIQEAKKYSWSTTAQMISNVIKECEM